MFRNKPYALLNFLYPLPLVVLFIVSTIDIFIDLGLSHFFAFIMLVVLMLPALIYNLYIKRKKPHDFYDYSEELPNPLRVSYDLTQFHTNNCRFA